MLLHGEESMLSQHRLGEKKNNCVKLEASLNSLFYQREFREILFNSCRKEWERSFLKSLGGKKKGTSTPTKEANTSTGHASIWCMVLWYINLQPRNLWLWRIFLQWGLYEFHGGGKCCARWALSRNNTESYKIKYRRKQKPCRRISRCNARSTLWMRKHTSKIFK